MSKRNKEDEILTAIIAGLDSDPAIEYVECEEVRPITDGEATLSVGLKTGENYMVNVDIYLPEEDGIQW